MSRRKEAKLRRAAEMENLVGILRASIRSEFIALGIPHQADPTYFPDTKITPSTPPKETTPQPDLGEIAFREVGADDETWRRAVRRSRKRYVHQFGEDKE